jgi:hypothetical protein
LDIEGGRLLETISLDHEYVSLQFPLREYVRRIEEFRRVARAGSGTGSAAETAWKLQINTMYGVLAGPHSVTNNIVAANQITAQARASAWVQFMALNGLQVITDGCSYRRDRIPACTFRECLERQADYPLRHADGSSGIPFYDPAEIPLDDRGFNQWFRQHVRRYFELDESVLDRLILHQLEHKLTGTTGSASLDAMACDGSANYVKLTASNGTWEARDSKMRGYGGDSKNELVPWIIEMYSADEMCELPPVTVDHVLLKLKPASNAADRALSQCSIREVILPLGYSNDVVKAYCALKVSAFICRDPRQYRALQRQVERLQRETGCGLDLLALRRAQGEADGSLSGVARRLFEYINSGRRDFSKAFNFRSERNSKRVDDAIFIRQDSMRSLRGQAETDLRSQMVIQPGPDDEPTGIIVHRLR